MYLHTRNSILIKTSSVMMSRSLQRLWCTNTSFLPQSSDSSTAILSLAMRAALGKKWRPYTKNTKTTKKKHWEGAHQPNLFPKVHQNHHWSGKAAILTYWQVMEKWTVPKAQNQNQTKNNQSSCLMSISRSLAPPVPISLSRRLHLPLGWPITSRTAAARLWRRRKWRTILLNDIITM